MVGGGKKFTRAEEVVDFLKNQPEVISAAAETKNHNKTIIVELGHKIHPARKFAIAHYLLEKCSGTLGISVIEKPKMQK